MRVRLCEGTRLAGPLGNWGPGDVVDVIDAAGMAMVARGQAVAVDSPRSRAATPETATVPEPETATVPAATAKPRRRRKSATGVATEDRDG